MVKILDFELKAKSRKIIAFLTITFQLLAFFGTELGITDSLKPLFLVLTVFGFSFFVIAHFDVWQKTKNNQG